jgi:hypothetical protein
MVAQGEILEHKCVACGRGLHRGANDDPAALGGCWITAVGIPAGVATYAEQAIVGTDWREMVRVGGSRLRIIDERESGLLRSVTETESVSIW